MSDSFKVSAKSIIWVECDRTDIRTALPDIARGQTQRAKIEFVKKFGKQPESFNEIWSIIAEAVPEHIRADVNKLLVQATAETPARPLSGSEKAELLEFADAEEQTKGDSESLLGEFLKSGKFQYSIYAKLNPVLLDQYGSSRSAKGLLATS